MANLAIDLEALRAAIEEMCFLCPEPVLDGNFQRCAVTAKDKQNTDGAYKGWDDGVPCMYCKNWVTGEGKTFHLWQKGRSLSPEERRQYKERMEQAKAESLKLQKERWAKAKQTASSVWKRSSETIPAEFAYLKKKQLDAASFKGEVRYSPAHSYEGREYPAQLVLPVYGEHGLQSLQFINEDGDKRFLAGGEMVGGCCFLSAVPLSIDTDIDEALNKPDILLVGEGLATVKSACIATGYNGAVVFDCHKMKKATERLRKNRPNTTLVILEDDDRKSEASTGNPGVEHAYETAKAVNAYIAHVEAPEGVSMDFNDLHCTSGLEAVKAKIEAALKAETLSATWEMNRQWVEEHTRGNVVFQPKVKAETAQPKAWEDVVELEGANKVPALDLDCLPDLLATYVPALANATQVPLDFAFAMVLPCLATAAQGRYAVQIHKGWVRPLCLYVMSPLGSGDRKSTTIDICKEPLTDIETAKQEKAAKDSKQTETTIELKRIDLNELVRNYGKATGEERDRLAERIRELKDSFPEMPTTPFLFTENATIESLGVLMTENKERMSIITGEAEFLNNLDGMYNGGKVTSLDLVLEAWGGGRVSIHRITRDAVLLKSPLLSLGFGAQPLFFTDRKNKSAFRARGVDGRFLYVMPSSFQGARNVRISPHLPEEIQEPYARVIKLLMDEYREPESNKQATPLVLTEEAEEEMYQFAEAIEAKLGKGGELEEMRDWANRIVDNVGRIAALFHCVEHPEAPAQDYIPLETVSKAVTLGYYFIEHAKAAYGLMDDDELIAKAKKVLEWIQRQAAADGNWKQFSVRECHTALRRKKDFAHVSEIKTALQELEERHYVRQAPIVRSSSKPTVIYEVNPSILTHKG